jgi:glucuronosyltransferase
MSVRLLRVFVIFSALLVSINGFKVLGILPFGSNSHFAIGQGILKSLSKAGHEVTVISPYPQKKPVQNWHDVDASSVLKKFQEGQ